jgi:hypothetical protein
MEVIHLGSALRWSSRQRKVSKGYKVSKGWFSAYFTYLSYTDASLSDHMYDCMEFPPERLRKKDWPIIWAWYIYLGWRMVATL